MTRFVAACLAAVLAAATTAHPDDAHAPEAPAHEAEKTPERLAADLIDRLAKTEDADEAAGIVSALDQVRLRSGSDTSELLMARALQATQAKSYPLALSLLDAVVDLQPEWAEGWNKRATVRFLAGDYRGSMADVAQTLKRDPKHIGALAGMGAMLEEEGLKDQALRAYERGLEIAPAYRPMKDAVDRLKAALAGETL
jgi:tetratricopeptide (TPR) repeat protein